MYNVIINNNITERSHILAVVCEHVLMIEKTRIIKKKTRAPQLQYTFKTNNDAKILLHPHTFVHRYIT